MTQVTQQFDISVEAMDEIEALIAIYGDDCREETVANINKWMTKTPQKRVVLTLTPLNYELVNFVAVHLSVQVNGVTDAHIKELQRLLQNKATELKGQPMVYDLAEMTREFLDSHNSTLLGSSVFDEMQDRMLQASQKLFVATPPQNQMNSIGNSVSHGAEIEPATSSGISFSSVEKGSKFSNGILSTIYHAHLIANHIDTIGVPLMIHSIPIRNPFYMTAEGKAGLNEVLSLIRKQSSLSHPNIQYVFDARIIPMSSQQSDGVRLEVLVEASGQGMYNMEILLKQAGCISIASAIGYTKKLLKGLAHIHAHNGIHKDIKCLNILFCGTPEQVEVKLSGGEYARKILDLHQSHPFASELRTEVVFADGWNPPESLPISGRKGDIWCIGRSFCHMIYGERIFKEFASASDFLEQAHQSMSPQLSEFLHRIFDDDTLERPSAVDLLKDTLFADDTGTPISLELMRNQKPNSTQKNQNVHHALVPSTPVPTAGHFTGNLEHATSRYHTDFEEVDFLGKKGSGVKLLREVQTLSRLHHHNIVRYYQAWCDFASDSDEFEDESSDDESTTSGSDDYLVKSSSDWHSSRHASHIVFQISSSDGDVLIPETDSPWDSEDESMQSSMQQGIRILFIQMEFCENNTLSDVIRGGIDVAEAWRLFRQILEGLAYLHNVGIIHRDLKPSNLFMDSWETKGTNPIDLMSNSLVLGESIDNREDGTMTQEIGTPVYVAPELLQRSVAVKYNSKVDIYSLGIVFFEMLYPFGTGMQRVTVLTELRKPEINFPEDFDSKRLESAYVILNSMLTHFPKERPSCQELLESKHLPPKLEQDILSEALRSIVNPENPAYYSRLYLAFDFTDTSSLVESESERTSNNAEFTARRLAFTLTQVHSKIMVIFQKHGAVEMSTPLLIPCGSFAGLDGNRASESNKTPVKLIDPSGMVLHLPYDLTVPYARYIGRQKNIPLLKRFTFDRVYRANQVGGQPGSFLECDFDIVSKTTNMSIPDAEVISVALEVVESACSFDSKSLVKSCKLSKNAQDVLENLFLIKGEFDQAISRFEDFVTSLHSSSSITAISTLKLLQKNITSLGTKHKLVFSPLLSHNSSYYKTGMFFQVALVKGKRIDILAAGGRYDALVSEMRKPFYSRDPICAVALSKIISHANIHSAESQVYRLGKSRGVDILVVSFGRGNVALDERLSIMGECWKAGLSAEVLLDETEITTDIVQVAARGYNLCVIVKSKDVKPAIIKVKNMTTKEESEVSRSELIQHLINELGSITGKNTPWRKEKFKGKERARIQDRVFGYNQKSLLALKKEGVVKTVWIVSQQGGATPHLLSF
ncbi:kinase-like protein [Rhizoclosmatium globosum]|uniref:non-specific serine/threonine protein kinase n=1 Tax=Rhizoclosmatium globosum TaxID=329046 RepID=A0A1Y2CPI6_9FUNG|nr:kinase-like protein [Rhizoclosmatium globosum]|eukprot:ORY48245.1 kinase-like protein [Rhizoclosmatium globosum]